MKGNRVIKILSGCFIIIAVIVASILGTYGYLKDKAVVEKSEWTGSYQVNSYQKGKQVLLNVFCKDDKYTFELNEAGEKILSEGDVKLDGENHISLYDGEKKLATVFFSNNDFYFVKDNLSVVKVQKIADSGITLHHDDK
ncbi:MAG: hypothetical protein K5851_03130 [Lachnospiraceae bacterium]|nr:hypothetical protein [Lachnospiraceae bacterium]